MKTSIIKVLIEKIFRSPKIAKQLNNSESLDLRIFKVELQLSELKENQRLIEESLNNLIK